LTKLQNHVLCVLVAI